MIWSVSLSTLFLKRECSDEIVRLEGSNCLGVRDTICKARLHGL